jgi:hypothetical protein
VKKVAYLSLHCQSTTVKYRLYPQPIYYVQSLRYFLTSPYFAVLYLCRTLFTIIFTMCTRIYILRYTVHMLNNIFPLPPTVHDPEMRHCDISKEMSSLYFGLAIFCLFEARVSEFDKQPPPPLNTAS